MSLWRQLTRGLRVLGNRKAADQEIADEVSHYLDEATTAFIARGLPPDEARRAARLELGGTTAGNPGFTAVSIRTLGLGIGASTAIFSVVDAVLLRALPYPNPQNIVRVWEQSPDGRRMNLAWSNFDDFRTQANTFASLAAYEYWLSSVSGGSDPVRINIAEVSSGFFKALGVEPFRGRAFAPDEQRLHGAPAAIVSFSYWQRYLGGTTDLSQFHLRMEEAVYPVVGHNHCPNGPSLRVEAIRTFEALSDV